MYGRLKCFFVCTVDDYRGVHVKWIPVSSSLFLFVKFYLCPLGTDTGLILQKMYTIHNGEYL